MAKTTRKSEEAKGTAKPVARRKKPTAAKPAKAKVKAKARAVRRPAVSEPTYEEIAVRAYHIYLRRNGRPGNPEHDWLQAISEIRAERT
ncbi:MAG: DUF2934 domain-containing protein [Acidobacteria bacterium]|nr:DUF2934 domain-containing protein [Acidobacteriota bacterium]